MKLTLPGDILEGLREEGEDETEVMALRISLDLVPEWSRVVERMAADFGVAATAAAEEDAYVIRVQLKKADKPRFVAELRKYWIGFQEYREREGRPVHTRRYRHDDQPVDD